MKQVLRLALWAPLLIAAVLAGLYIYLHDPFARDGAQLVRLPLSPTDPTVDRLGDAHYRGGLDIPRMDQNIGGLSGLRWDAQSGRLLAITDDARWVWITPEERGPESGGELVGIAKIESGPLLGEDGMPLTGKTQGDSESVTRSAKGGWLIGFERNHRVLHYPTLTATPTPATIDPVAEFAPMEENAGLETLAGDENTLFACAERAPSELSANCLWSDADGALQPYALDPIRVLANKGAVPTDADRTRDGTVYVLFRSYSPSEGNWVGVSALGGQVAQGARRDELVLDPSMNVDNFEGLAVREEEGRTFLYIVSDDNFSGSQRTLLMKFEIVPS